MQLQLVQVEISLCLQVCTGKGNIHKKNSHIIYIFIYCHKDIHFWIIWIKDSIQFPLKCERRIICKKQSRDAHFNDLLKQIRMFSFLPAYPINLQTDPETRENTFMPFHVYLILLCLPPFLCEISACYHFYFHIVT